MDVQSSLNIVQSSSSPSSATVPVLPSNPPPSLVHPPTSEEIDAVIQQATSAVSSDGRHVPLKDTRTQLFVGNLPYRVRWQDLKDLFRKAGTVLRADVSLGPDNRSRGHGTVLLATAEDAGRAVDMFNGYSWQSRVLEVRLDRLPSDFDNFSNPTLGYHIPAPISSHAPVITGGLRPPHSFPTTLPPSISPLPSTSFAPQIPPRSALDESNPDHFMIFGHDRPATAGGISRNLFVGNLPFHCQWQDLKDLFRQAGTILRADVALGQDGRSRGFGTVVFATEHDAERAVNMFNGYEYNSRPLKVHYDKFMPSVGQSLTAPSSPSLTSPFSGVNVASLASMANVTARPTSSRSNPLPPQPPQSLDYTAYYLSRVKSRTSPPPLNVLPSFPRSQPQALLPRVGATPEHQLLAHLSSLGLSDPMDTNNSILRKESPSIGLSDLPTPPSSSAGISSTKGSRVSSPPLHLPQPLPKKEFPPPQNHAVGDPFTFTASASSTHPESSHSLPMPIPSSQRETAESLEQTSPPSRQRAHTHPAHPGPISIPPASTFVAPPSHTGDKPPSHTLSPVSPMFAPGTHISPSHKLGVPMHSPLTHPHSPLHHPMYSHARPPLQHPAHPPSLTLNMTPSGLPPITPSMPSFQFVPGPPTLSQSNHPAVTFSPASTMSPGAFWGRPGGNPLTNAAVGAPVSVTKGQSGEEIDYFSGASTDASEGEGYFPPLSQTGSTLSKEILREDSVGERQAALSLAMENGVDQEVSTSNGSSGRASAKELASGSGVDEVIEQTRRNLNLSHAENTRRMEEQGHSKSLSSFKDTDRVAVWSGERVSPRSCTTRAQSN